MEKIGNKENWDDFVNRFIGYGAWLQTDTMTYYGDVETQLPQVSGRVVYRTRYSYVGTWKHGSMIKGIYFKYMTTEDSKSKNWSFEGTFTKGNCPHEGIFDHGYERWDITCTEKKDIHTQECWEMMKELHKKTTAAP